MPYRIVHCADLHLETTFPASRGGARRRAALADAFVRIVDKALALRADALTIGGDLYEAERATPQTARFIFEQCARFGKPVFVAPGNHDPYGASSPFARGDVPPNVHVFTETAWRAHPLGDELSLYGFAHSAAEPGRPFANARFERGGVRIALVHGSDEERCPPNKRATAPFTQDEIARAGASLLLTGHYHGGYVVPEGGRPVIAYPGSPEPIKSGERGNHGALDVKIANGRITVTPIPIARTRVVELDCDVSDATNETAIVAAVNGVLDGYGADDYVRVRLVGAIAAGTRIDRAFLAERLGNGLGSLAIDDETIDADYGVLALEPTVRGRVVRDLMLLAHDIADPRSSDARRALRLCVAAFEGAELVP